MAEPRPLDTDPMLRLKLALFQDPLYHDGW